MPTDYRKVLISRAVKNLRDFGYPVCNEENILTDMIYNKLITEIDKDD